MIMNRWILSVLIISLVFFVCSATGRASDDLDAALETAVSANSLAEMQAASSEARFQYPFIIEGLWYAAAFMSWPEDFQRDAGLQARVLKIFVFATLLELTAKHKIWLEDEPLFSLGPASLKTLGDNIDLARPGSPRHILFLRMPELRKDFWRGYYQYLHFDSHLTGQRIILERSDVPWSNLDFEYKVTRIESLPEKNSTRHVEGLSYSFPLSVMNHFVIAAKVYAALSLLGPESPYVKYAHLIIANSFYAAALAEGNGHSAIDFSRTAISPMKKAMDGLHRAPARHGRLLSVSALEPRLTAMNFFGRKLHVAAERYRRAAERTDREPGYRLYGHWGRAITAVGLMDARATVTHLKAVLAAISDESPDHERYRYILIALFDIFDKQSAVGRTLSAEQKRIDLWRLTPIHEYHRHMMNLDLSRLLWTIGRFNEAALFWIREIQRLPAEGIIDSTKVEKEYLHELIAFMSDMFTLLSWKISFERGGDTSVPRIEAKKIWAEDFAPTWADRFSGGGNTPPYGSVSPEEDRVTCLEAYNPSANYPTVAQAFAQVAEQNFQALGLTEPEENGARTAGGEMVPWARKEQKRGNFEPLLKLAWVEWFQLPLLPLLNVNFKLDGWAYQPLTVGNVATPQAVQAVAELEDDRLDPATQQVAKTFLMVRHFLENRYVE